MIRDIYFHGRLADMYTSEVQTCDVDTPYAVISAMNSRFKGFRDNFFRGEKIVFLTKTGDAWGTVSDAAGMPLYSKLGDAQELHLAFIEQGSGPVAAAFAAAASWWTGLSALAKFAIYLGTTIALNYISASLVDTPSASDAKELDSFAFDGALNLQGVGNPVPLVYGQFMCGSVVIGADISVEQNAIAFDNYTEVSAGQTKTGNVLDNDALGSTLSVTAWTVDGTTQTLGSNYTAADGSTITLSSTGDYSVVAAVLSTQATYTATYTATDGSKTITANWKIVINEPYEPTGGA